MNSVHAFELGTDPPSANLGVAKLRLQLLHVPLTELESMGLVRWDREHNVVREGTSFDDP